MITNVLCHWHRLPDFQSIGTRPSILNLDGGGRCDFSDSPDSRNGLGLVRLWTQVCQFREDCIGIALHWCRVFNVMLNQIFFATRVNKLHSVSVRLFANLFRFSILRTYLTQDASKFWVLESSQKVFRLYLKSLLVPCSCSLSLR